MPTNSTLNQLLQGGYNSGGFSTTNPVVMGPVYNGGTIPLNPVIVPAGNSGGSLQPTGGTFTPVPVVNNTTGTTTTPATNNTTNTTTNPGGAATTPTGTTAAVQTETAKPIYMQWWFYAIVLGVVAGGYFIFKKFK